MLDISIVIPCDTFRLPLLIKSWKEYSKYPLNGIEVLIISRTIKKLKDPCFPSNTRLIHYVSNKQWANPCRALNIGTAKSSYDNIIITSPEVYPKEDIISKIKNLNRNNYLFQVFKELPNGSIHRPTLNLKKDPLTPELYFLAMFKKEDIIAINGWDDRFVDGYACEDTDFGNRFTRAGLKFEPRRDIHAFHAYHNKPNTGKERYRPNLAILKENDKNKIIKPKLGISQYLGGK